MCNVETNYTFDLPRYVVLTGEEIETLRRLEEVSFQELVQAEQTVESVMN